VPTFTAPYDPQGELILVIFLGYEGDRALALWENIEPHRTIAVIGKPAYYPEWEGQTEKMNTAILAAIDEDSILYADSRDPHSAKELLKELIFSHPKRNDNWYIAPLGTKLQTVGIYYFISEHPEAANVVYASPQGHNQEYFSTGIGRTIIIPAKTN